MKIQARSTYNGLVQEVDINMAHCLPLCHEPPPAGCEGGYQLADGIFDGPAGHLEQTTRLGSTYGAVGPVAALPVLGFLTASPFPTCDIETPGTEYRLYAELRQNGLLIVGVTIMFEAGNYYVVPSSPEFALSADGCLTLTAFDCVAR
jgi:hypothetical protein